MARIIDINPVKEEFSISIDFQFICQFHFLSNLVSDKERQEFTMGEKVRTFIYSRLAVFVSICVSGGYFIVRITRSRHKLNKADFVSLHRRCGLDFKYYRL